MMHAASWTITGGPPGSRSPEPEVFLPVEFYAFVLRRTAWTRRATSDGGAHLEDLPPMPATERVAGIGFL
jgi:hypothetical protein